MSVRTDWVVQPVLLVGPETDDAHGRAAPANLHGLAGPSLGRVLAEALLHTHTRAHKINPQKSIHASVSADRNPFPPLPPLPPKNRERGRDRGGKKK